MTAQKRREQTVRAPSPPLRKAPSAPPPKRSLGEAVKDSLRMRRTGVPLSAPELAAAQKARATALTRAARARDERGRFVKARQR